MKSKCDSVRYQVWYGSCENCGWILRLSESYSLSSCTQTRQHKRVANEYIHPYTPMQTTKQNETRRQKHRYTCTYSSTMQCRYRCFEVNLNAQSDNVHSLSCLPCPMPTVCKVYKALFIFFSNIKKRTTCQLEYTCTLLNFGFGFGVVHVSSSTPLEVHTQHACSQSGRWQLRTTPHS